MIRIGCDWQSRHSWPPARAREAELAERCWSLPHVAAQVSLVQGWLGTLPCSVVRLPLLGPRWLPGCCHCTQGRGSPPSTWCSRPLLEFHRLAAWGPCPAARGRTEAPDREASTQLTGEPGSGTAAWLREGGPPRWCFLQCERWGGHTRALGGSGRLVSLQRPQCGSIC